MDQAPLGFKAPRPHYPRKFWCPACDDGQGLRSRLNSLHVLADCKAVSATRNELGISSFLAACKAYGRGRDASYVLYVNGKLPDGTAASPKDTVI